MYSFTGGADGESPYEVDPVFDQAGNLYGTTVMGGTLAIWELFSN